MKKLYLYFICTFILFSTFIGVYRVKADGVNETLESESVYLLDYNSKTVLFTKNEDKHLKIASMTKIMLLDLCFQKYSEGCFDFDDVITVSKNASGMGGSQVFLVANGSYKIGELIKSIIIASANDASVAMAEYLYGSEEECVNQMNERAKQLGMNDTVYSNCTGLPKVNQYSSAKDVATVFCDLIKNDKYFEFSKIWMDKIDHPDGTYTGLTNTNKLVRFYDGCDSGKTGYTSESGFCISASAKRGNMRLVAVVINCPSSKKRFNEVSQLFNYGFNNFVNKTVVDSTVPLNIEFKVENGKSESIELISKENFYIFSKKNVKDDITIDFEPIEVKAPLKKGDKVGEIIIFNNNVEIGRVDCLTNQDVDRKVFFDYLKDIASQWNI